MSRTRSTDEEPGCLHEYRTEGAAAFTVASLKILLHNWESIIPRYGMVWDHLEAGAHRSSRGQGAQHTRTTMKDRITLPITNPEHLFLALEVSIKHLRTAIQSKPPSNLTINFPTTSLRTMICAFILSSPLDFELCHENQAMVLCSWLVVSGKHLVDTCGAFNNRVGRSRLYSGFRLGSALNCGDSTGAQSSARTAGNMREASELYQ